MMNTSKSKATKDTKLGKNRTGIELSPVDKRSMAELADMTVPSMEGDESEMAAARAEYIEQNEKIGSVPPPATFKGAAATVVDALKGANATALVDKLGERLAFERAGTRLYEALIAKAENAEPFEDGPTLEELQQIHDEERQHFELVRDVIVSLGADPTVITPSADVAAVSAMGLLQVVSDPRMSFKQSLESALTAELVDNDAWEMLIALARSMGHEEIANEFEVALEEEEEHLDKVRSWVSSAVLGAAGRSIEDVGSPA